MMTPKQEAALRQALDCVSTLANARDWVGCTPNERWDEDEMYAELCNATICLKKSLSIIQEALAEQPAQEPVAWINTTGDFLFQHPEEHGRENEEWFPLVHQNTSPPASKPWVGLTPEDHQAAWDAMNDYEDYDTYGAVLEAKLREKNAQPSKPLTDEQRKAIVVCFTSGKVSVSEVQRKLAISYNEAQQLCQSIVDLGLAQGLQLAPSLDRHGIKGDA